MNTVIDLTEKYAWVDELLHSKYYEYVEKEVPVARKRARLECQSPRPHKNKVDELVAVFNAIQFHDTFLGE